MNYSGSFSWVTFNIVLLFYYWICWVLSSMVSSSKSYEHCESFSCYSFKIKAVHCKTSYPGKGTFSVSAHCSFSTYISPELPAQFQICSHKLIQVFVYELGHRTQGECTCCTVPFLFLLGYDVLFWVGSGSTVVSLEQVYGRSQCNRDKCWWVNNESLRRSRVLSKERNQQFQIISRSVSEDFRLCWRFCLQLLLCHVVCVGSILCCDICCGNVKHTYVCMLVQVSQEVWSSCTYVFPFLLLLLFCRAARGHSLLL